MLNVTLEKLSEMHGKDKAESVFREIADLGGYGDVGTGQGNIDINYAGGLGILGALRDDNTALTDKAKNRIAELAGVDRKKDIDNHVGVGLPRTQSKDSVEDGK